MEGVEIHSASPISSDSSKDDLKQEKKKSAVPVRPPLGKHTTSWTSYMIRHDAESSGSNPGATRNTSSDAKNTANRRHSTTDVTMEDVPLVAESNSQAPTIKPMEPVKANSPSNADTDVHAISSTTNAAAAPPPPPPPQKHSPQRKSVSRIHTRNTSISATMDLPWNIDNTSSSYTASSHHRNSSFGIPPPPKAGEITRNSSNYSTASMPESPKLHPLMTRVAPSSPAPYSHSSTHQAPSPYTSIADAGFIFDFPTANQYQNQPQQKQHTHTHSLSNPPGYIQNTAASFSSTNPSHSNSNSTSYSQASQASRATPSTSTSISISTSFTSPSRRSSTYSNYSPLDTTAPALYTSNTSPFYQNTTAHDSNSGYNNTFFSPSFSFSAPKTPTPKKLTRAGILDNDPSIYLTRGQSSGAQDEEGSIWDTATKWMKSTSNKLSYGGENNGMARSAEYSVSGGLWKMVAGGGGGERRDGY